MREDSQMGKLKISVAIPRSRTPPPTHTPCTFPLPLLTPSPSSAERILDEGAWAAFASALLLRVWADSNLAFRVDGNSTAKHF